MSSINLHAVLQCKMVTPVHQDTDFLYDSTVCTYALELSNVYVSYRSKEDSFFLPEERPKKEIIQVNRMLCIRGL